MHQRYYEYKLVLIVLTNFSVLWIHVLATNEQVLVEQIKTFKEKVSPVVQKSSKTLYLLQDNLYILKWLHYGNFDTSRAIQLFKNHLDWRRKNNIDNIHLENFTRIIAEYPIFTDTIDRQGRPIIEEWLSEWNIRRAAFTGEIPKLVRMRIYIMEKAQKRLYDLRMQNNSTITGIVELVNADGFNSMQHGCAQCISMLMRFTDITNRHYPGLWDDIYMINVGALYRSFLIAVPNTYDTKEKRVIHYYNRKLEWGPVLERTIARNQRSHYFGGNLDRQLTR